MTVSKRQFFILFIFLCACILALPTAAFCQTKTSYVPLEVGEHWSRRSVSEEGSNSRIYYRPKRFSYMEMQTDGTQTIQLRAFSTQKTNTIEVKIKIGNDEKRYTLDVLPESKNLYFTEPIDITIPAETQSISLYTRNPNAFFRHYEVKTRFMQPKVYTLQPTSFSDVHKLKSGDSSSEYHSATQKTHLVYKITEDGTVHFYLRSIRTNKKEVLVDLFINDSLHETIIIRNSTSNDYSLGDLQVSTGRRIENIHLKKDDVLTLVPQSDNEVICRMFLTSKEFY
ncbi:MAG: hypothetical protein FWG20_03115 [Candidatus Cloacimonetes bacterium]|nr:hypothetical protein [Candidatus Cloacimonadota bacterium]